MAGAGAGGAAVILAPTEAAEEVAVTAAGTVAAVAAVVGLAAGAGTAGTAAAAVSDGPVPTGGAAVSALAVPGVGGVPLRTRLTLRDAEATVSRRYLAVAVGGDSWREKGKRKEKEKEKGRKVWWVSFFILLLLFLHFSPLPF